MKTKKVCLSYGMGVESTLVLVRFLLEAAIRTFDLKDLIVMTSMTGNEWNSTKMYVTQFVLPLLRQFEVRYVQVAKAGPSEKDGIVVLSDTRKPDRLYIEGAYTIQQELSVAGTLPMWRPYSRFCSSKFKAKILDSWVEQELKGAEYRHILGFNSEELDRAERDHSYTTETRKSEHPMIEWGWNRERAIQYLKEAFGIIWPKSCCAICPFSDGKIETLQRYANEPEAAMLTLQMEWVAIALNPKMALFPSGSLREALIVNGFEHLVDQMEAAISLLPWRIYRVRRIRQSKRVVHRKIDHIAEGARAEMQAALKSLASEKQCPITYEGGIPRFYVERRDENHPLEDMYVAAPAVVAEKSRAKFSQHWDLRKNERWLFPEIAA